LFRDRWRLMPFQINSAAVNMAIDEAIAESISFNESNPTIRFYGWQPSAVSIGCFQSMQDEVDLNACEKLGIDVVRRRTGGGAVYHDTAGEITYSVICPEPMMDRDIGASYRTVCGWVVEALAEIGLQAEFQPINDVVVGGKKVSGSAQTRRKGIFTMHGTVLYSVNRERMFSVLKVGRAKVSDKVLANFGDRVAGVSELVQVNKDKLLLQLVSSFIKGKEWFMEGLGRDEAARTDIIASSRYASDTWNLSR
jgi:lipoate-protein ligase A